MRLFFVIFIIFIFNACKYSEQPKVFENESIYMEYPSYLKKSKDIFPVNNLLAGLKNDYRDVFFILLDYGQKPGENGFEIMYDSLTTQLKNGIREPFVEKDTSFVQNGFKVREMHLSGIVANTEQEKRMYFIFNLFEDKNAHLYQTCGWCFRHKRDIWQKDIQGIAYSLKAK
jgi:hypothetical protein